MNIICDTNIWYELARDKISPEVGEGNRICATYINLVELSCSPKLLHDLSLVQSAVTHLHDSHPLIYEANPIEYIIKHQYPEYSSPDNQYPTILKGFEKLIKVDVTEESDDKLRDAFKKSIYRRASGLRQSAEEITKLLLDIRENIKKSTAKNEHRQKNSLPIFKDLINLFVKQYTKGELELDIDSYPWEKIEFSLRVWDTYFKDLELSKSQKFKANDWPDLLNMLYVEPGTKYWTLEDKWTKLISRDEKIIDYLFISD